MYLNFSRSKIPPFLKLTEDNAEAEGGSFLLRRRASQFWMRNEMFPVWLPCNFGLLIESRMSSHRVWP